MTTRPPLVCDIDAELPGCDTGPAGRLSFVLREARVAWRARRARTPAPTPPNGPADPRHGDTR